MSISRLKSIELVMKPFILFGMIINCCLTSIVTGNSHSPEHSIIRTQVDSALDALNVGDIARSTAILHNFLLQAPNDVDANQFLGSIYVQLKEHQKGSIYLSKAVEFSNWQQAHIIANYIESLRGANFLVDAWNVCVKAVEIHPSSEHILFNAGIVARDRKEYSSAIGLFQRTVTLNPSRYSAWDEGADAMINNIQLEAAEIFLEEANKTFPRNTALMSKLAFCKHKQKKLKEAEALLSDALLLEPDSYLMNGNMGAIMQTMGRSEEARNFYKKCMPFKAGDYGLRNNYGALLGEMGLKEEELYWLKKSLEIEPSEHVLFNLGGYYQDEGLIDIAREYFNRAILVSEKSSLLKLRVMLMLYPVCSSWEVMIGQRNLMEASLLQVLADPIAPQKHHIDSSLNRIHFYLVYHGLNDRYMQELIIRAYNKHLEGLFYLKAELQLQNGGSFLSELQTELLPKRQQHLQISTQQTLTGTSLMNEDKISRKVRVGFMSMFFSIFEPHGMLLDGVMKNLPRSHFEVLAMPIVRNDGMPLSPSFIESCDKVVNIPQSNIALVYELISSLDLDILVLADTMAEPTTHFLSQSRIAKVQMAFWGSPITSGSASIDYFVSGELLEHPFRTRMPVSQEPYTEQVVLLEGQGIWYNVPEAPDVTLKKSAPIADHRSAPTPNTVFNRSQLSLPEDAFLYFCPQSVFKMHPHFDYVIADILLANPLGHVVITGGRRPLWTTTYMARLKAALGVELMQRLHLIERVSSENFLALLDITDAMLHPFPFDGSRTSADGLVAGLPMVTLPTEYLRGRMGAAFLRTMNMPELVARSRSEYVQIAAKLGLDKSFYSSTVAKIKERLPLVWEDMEYAFSWARLLSNSVGLTPLSWEDYILQTGRDLTRETSLRDERRKNQRAFDITWGAETWLLEDNVAHLESHLKSSERPKVFNDWVSQVNRTVVNKANLIDRDARGASSADNRDSIAGIEGRNSSVRKSGKNNLVDDKQAMPFDSNPEDAFLMDEGEAAIVKMGKLAGENRWEESYQVGANLLSTGQYWHNPNLLLQVGTVHFHRGEYTDAYRLCTMALVSAPNSLEVNECVGISSAHKGNSDEYLGTKQDAINFYTAWQQQQKQEKGSIADMSSRTCSNFSFNTELNLLAALNAWGYKSECMDIIYAIMNVPSIEKGGAYLIYFSSVDWSARNQGNIEALGEQLSAAGILQLVRGLSFLGEIKRIQESCQWVISRAIRSLPLHLNEEVLSTLLRIATTPDPSLVTPQRRPLGYVTEKVRDKTSHDNKSYDTQLSEYFQKEGEEMKQGIVLLCQYFRPVNNSLLQRDLDTVLVKNLANPLIASIVLLTEVDINMSAFFDSIGGGKLSQIVVGQRLTFSIAFDFANQYLVGRTVILANADIYFDDSLLLLGDPLTLDLKDQVLALLKWIDEGGSSLSMILRTESQDAWIFQPPLQGGVVEQANFFLGTPMCDSRVAEILVSNGHPVLNPAFAIHAIEVHSGDRKENFYSRKDSPTGPFRNVLLSDVQAF